MAELHRTLLDFGMRWANALDIGAMTRTIILDMITRQKVSPLGYTVITNITSEVNFGGRVTDKWDRRLIACQLLDFVNQGVEAVDYKFSPSGYYKSIAAVDKEGYLGMCMSIYMASLCACEWCLHVFPCTWCMCARVHGVCMRM